ASRASAGLGPAGGELSWGGMMASLDVTEAGGRNYEGNAASKKRAGAARVSGIAPRRQEQQEAAVPGAAGMPAGALAPPPDANRSGRLRSFLYFTRMESGNQTHASEFLLLGFSEKSEIQFIIFGLFLSMYLLTVLGNLLIVLAVGSAPHLHTPMYFFLSNLSLADIGFTSTTVPKLLLNIQTHSRIITYRGCLGQIFFFIVFGCLDNLLLAAMAYDRFVAICHPLHYSAIMNPRLCGWLALGSWGLSVLGSLLETLTVLRLSFGTDVEVPHFFCDLPEVLKLARSDTFLNNVVVYFTTGLLAVVPVHGILLSYSKIVCSILRIPSAGGKCRAFSTCGSHLLVVSLFYGTGLGVYLSSAATSSSRSSLVASVIYTVVTPMLNPFIYSLRNRDVKAALERLLGKWTPTRDGGVMGTPGKPNSHLRFRPAGALRRGLAAASPLLLILVHVFGHIHRSLLIVLAIITAPTCTPMSFFLSSLSPVDICFTSTAVPQMLANLQAHSRAITHAGCLSQMFFFVLFGGLHDVLLTAMAYDWFVGICHLHYTAIRSPKSCGILPLASWCSGYSVTQLDGLTPELLHTAAHPALFCELSRVLQLACSNTSLSVLQMGWHLFSYSKITTSVLRISSASGKQRAFSTCRLTCRWSRALGDGARRVPQLRATHDSRGSAITSVTYTVATPMLNPFIYSLRNRDMKQAPVQLFRGRAADVPGRSRAQPWTRSRYVRNSTGPESILITISAYYKTTTRTGSRNFFSHVRPSFHARSRPAALTCWVSPRAHGLTSLTGVFCVFP
ncbi:LOW QUALITY PROTEIN: Olfactory receptor 7C1, partial [Galemys pyrenaicus]